MRLLQLVLESKMIFSHKLCVKLFLQRMTNQLITSVYIAAPLPRSPNSGQLPVEVEQVLKSVSTGGTAEAVRVPAPAETIVVYTDNSSVQYTRQL